MTLTLHPDEDGARLMACYDWHVYRFLLDSGQTVDVRAIHDDSDLRTAVCDLTKASIVATATLAEPEGGT